MDDTLARGPKNICEGVVKALQKLWKTGDPEFLTPSTPFQFLGVKVVLTKFGLYLQQHFYADEFLKKHVGTFGTRVRGTTAAPEWFSTKSSGEVLLKPDPENPQHQKQIKRAQQILGALLWLSTRTRPDLSYAVAMAASVQTRDLRDLEVRLRHLLQYVSSLSFSAEAELITPILRCDNQAVLAMLEKPSWRTRHISIRGEALRHANEDKNILITYVSTQNQVADPLTKPPARVNFIAIPIRL